MLRIEQVRHKLGSLFYEVDEEYAEAVDFALKAVILIQDIDRVQESYIQMLEEGVPLEEVDKIRNNMIADKVRTFLCDYYVDLLVAEEEKDE